MHALRRVIPFVVGLMIGPALLSCDSSTGDGVPTWPGTDDSRYAITASGTWLMVGDGFTQPNDRYVITVETPADETTIDVWLDEGGPQQFERSSEGPIVVELNVTDLDVGEHEVILAAPGATSAFARRTFKRSHALYFIMATDWDDPDNDQRWLDNMDELRELHRGLRFTHYFGPYSLTDPAVPPSRRQELVDWIVERRDDHGDEVGVHLHPYCSFVETTGVECRTEPSYIDDSGEDPTGYSIIVASYSTDEMTELLQAASDLFEDYGLGRPTSFRAGGWTADTSTTAALEAAGYTVQADAIVASAIEEWEGRGTLYDWLSDHWGSITTTRQPYYPSRDDIALAAENDDAFPVLQVPANAVIVDYVWESEIIEIFNENFPDGAALQAPTIVHTGLHPTNFGDGFLRTLDAALGATADTALHTHDEGPVVYATAAELVDVFSR